MQIYFFHKILAIAIVVALWLGSSVFIGSGTVEQWTLVLVATTIFGYSHYLVGGVYQLKSFKRKAQPQKRYDVFIVLTLLSIIFCSVFYYFEQTGLLSFVVIGYFMLHGYYNEITLFERQTSLKADVIGFTVPPIFLFGLAMLAVGHQSWFFSEELEFLSEGELALILKTITLAVGTGSVLVATLISWRQTILSSAYRIPLSLTSIGLFLFGGWAIWQYPISYIVMFSLLLLYHFIVWFVFYFEQFWRQRREQLPTYLGLHALVLAPFLLLIVGGVGAEWIDTYLLNSRTFLLATMIHISTSFMSESWFEHRFLS